MEFAIIEVGTNLQTAIAAVGVSWAVAFAIWAFCKYASKE